MSGFSADWLALREPFDERARDTAWPALDLPLHAARWRATRPGDARCAVIDLACGSGANLRALAPRLGGAQQWRLIDHDPALLAALPGVMARWARQHGYGVAAVPGQAGALRIDGPAFSVELVCEHIDLVRDLDALRIDQAQLVTASALLDLVSAEWLSALMGHASRHGAALLFALSVDGRVAWSPADTADDAVLRLFEQHQRRDKGFGPALGPAAVPEALRQLAAAGYAVQQARSDWLVDGAAAPAMLAALVEGTAAAAVEQSPGAAELVRGWSVRRLAALAHSRLAVGHIDLIGVPAR